MAVHSQGASVSVGADDVDVDVGVDGVRRASTSIGGAMAGAGDDTAAGVWMKMRGSTASQVFLMSWSRVWVAGECT